MTRIRAARKKIGAKNTPGIFIFIQDGVVFFYKTLEKLYMYI